MFARLTFLLSTLFIRQISVVKISLPIISLEEELKHMSEPTPKLMKLVNPTELASESDIKILFSRLQNDYEKTKDVAPQKQDINGDYSGLLLNIFAFGEQLNTKSTNATSSLRGGKIKTASETEKAEDKTLVKTEDIDISLETSDVTTQPNAKSASGVEAKEVSSLEDKVRKPPSLKLKIQPVDCSSPIDEANCQTSMNKTKRWAWFPNFKRCIHFMRGECGGNDNSYKSRADCELYCNQDKIIDSPNIDDLPEVAEGSNPVPRIQGADFTKAKKTQSELASDYEPHQPIQNDEFTEANKTRKYKSDNGKVPRDSHRDILRYINDSPGSEHGYKQRYHHIQNYGLPEVIGTRDKELVNDRVSRNSQKHIPINNDYSPEVEPNHNRYHRVQNDGLLVAIGTNNEEQAYHVSRNSQKNNPINNNDSPEDEHRNRPHHSMKDNVFIETKKTKYNESDNFKFSRNSQINRPLHSNNSLKMVHGYKQRYHRIQNDGLPDATESRSQKQVNDRVSRNSQKNINNNDSPELDPHHKHYHGVQNDELPEGSGTKGEEQVNDRVSRNSQKNIPINNNDSPELDPHHKHYYGVQNDEVPEGSGTKSEEQVNDRASRNSPKVESDHKPYDRIGNDDLPEGLEIEIEEQVNDRVTRNSQKNIPINNNDSPEVKPNQKRYHRAQNDDLPEASVTKSEEQVNDRASRNSPEVESDHKPYDRIGNDDFPEGLEIEIEEQVNDRVSRNSQKNIPINSNESPELEPNHKRYDRARNDDLPEALGTKSEEQVNDEDDEFTEDKKKKRKLSVNPRVPRNSRKNIPSYSKESPEVEHIYKRFHRIQNDGSKEAWGSVSQEQVNDSVTLNSQKNISFNGSSEEKPDDFERPSKQNYRRLQHGDFQTKTEKPANYSKIPTYEHYNLTAEHYKKTNTTETPIIISDDRRLKSLKIIQVLRDIKKTIRILKSSDSGTTTSPFLFEFNAENETFKFDPFLHYQNELKANPGFFEILYRRLGFGSEKQLGSSKADNVTKKTFERP